jgi:ribonuclease D
LKRLDKNEIKALPLFTGLDLHNIKIVENEQDAAQAIKVLQREVCLGFDTESKPTFKKGESSTGAALIQLASESQAFLFPTRFPTAVSAANIILSNAMIKKVGFGLKSDKSELRKLGIGFVNTEDLSVTVKNRAKERQRVGARAAIAMLLGLRLSKSAQMSNWGAYPLQEFQIKYAANDAYAAVCIERALGLGSNK